MVGSDAFGARKECSMTFPFPDDRPAIAHTEAVAALATWQAAHPDATLAEIEHAVDRHLSAYRAALITTAAAARAPDTRPVCPGCGTGLQRVGRRSRHLATAQGGDLVFHEPVWRCPACGAGLSPPR